MATPYKPRELTNEQKVFQVLLETNPGQGAYGLGETKEEAEKNARYFLRRDFGPAQKVARRAVFKWSAEGWVEACKCCKPRARKTP